MAVVNWLIAHEVKYIDLDEWDFPDAIEVLNADEIHAQRRTYVHETFIALMGANYL